jgi:hypothetical protein
MSRHRVIYTRLSRGWSAELATPFTLVLSATTLSEVQDAVRAAVGSRLAIDPADVMLEELVDAGENSYARLP